jgi:enoyl-CoA hydratase
MPDRYEHLIVDTDGAVSVVTLNRPTVLNALNAALLEELSRALRGFDDDASVRAVIVTGSGDKAFAAGADIAELNALHDKRDGRAAARVGQALTRQIERMRVPVIAAVNGFALGGGCELAMACDIRIASERARFGQPEVNLGIIPGYGGSQRTLRLTGRGQAMYLCLTGEIIDAQEALRIGLVERVVPPEQLMPEARRIAALIASKAPLAVAACKKVIDAGAHLPIDEALEVEAKAFGTLVASNDFHEGSVAFLEKRAPRFSGT